MREEISRIGRYASGFRKKKRKINEQAIRERIVGIAHVNSDRYALRVSLAVLSQEYNFALC